MNRFVIVLTMTPEKTKKGKQMKCWMLGFYVSLLFHYHFKNLFVHLIQLLWEITSKRCQHLINWWCKDAPCCLGLLCSNSASHYIGQCQDHVMDCYTAKELNRIQGFMPSVASTRIIETFESEAFHPCG